VNDTGLEPDGVERLLGVDDPIERKLALKSHTVSPWHLRLALQDEDPDVREATALHPELTPELQAEILRGDDRWLAHTLLTRPDLSPAVLDAAMEHPDLHDAIADHPALTQEQKARLQVHPEISPELQNVLVKSELAKNVGFVTFPKLDNDALRNQATYFPKHYSKYVKGITGRASHTGDMGTTSSTQLRGSGQLPATHQKMTLLARRPKPIDRMKGDTQGVEQIRQHLFGDQPADRKEQLKTLPGQMKTARELLPGKMANATEAHEVQHGIFGRLGQKYGGENRRKIAAALLAKLPDEVRDPIFNTFNTFSGGYHPIDWGEEQIAFAHNYLMDPNHRAKVHIRLGIYNDTKAQHALQNSMRKAWQHMQRTALHMTPEELGLPPQKSEGEALADYAKRLAKARQTSTDGISDHLGFNHRQACLVEAATFLSGRPVDPHIFRARLAETGDDLEAILQAAGLTPQDKEALLGVLAITDLNKSDGPAMPKSIKPMTPSAKELADELQWAADNSKIEEVHLGGKHSKGTLLAHDKDDNMYLLKPGSSTNSPALGVDEEPASQSRREAAFSAVAKSWGIGDVPQAELVSVDGKEVAAIRMLGLDYTGLARAAQKDPSLPRRAIRPYFDDGKIFRWSVLDGVLASVDRHGNNLMINDEGHVALIDHGSSFAGFSFNPGNDDNSFVPYYLRVWGPDKGWNKMSKDQQLASLPRLPDAMDEVLKKGVLRLDIHDLSEVLLRYGINPAPSVARLKKVQSFAEKPSNLSVGLNRMWTGLDSWV
jgi:hypothetical protein